MRKSSIFTAVAFSAALAVVIPGIAYASTMTSVTVQTPGASSGPSGADTELLTDADCASGALVSGGGVKLTIGTGMASHGVHVMGTEPSTSASSESTGNDMTHWLGIAGTGAGGSGSYTTQPFAVCFTSNTITHTQAVTSTVNGPSGTDGTKFTLATCPSGTRLLGGGVRSKLTSNGSVKAIASYPTFNNPTYDNGLIAATAGDSNPDSWAVVALNGGGTGTGDTTTAYAVCSGANIDVSGVTVTVQHSSAAGPTSGSQTTPTVNTCGTGQNMISGGASISGGDPTSSDFTAPGSQGDHLIGSYPSDSSGNTVSDGTTNAGYWSAGTDTGGAGSPTGTQTDVWALCVA